MGTERDLTRRALVFRHAEAADRSKWTGPDRERPLTEIGRAQAEVLVDRRSASIVERVISSPARRCVDTVVPLAADAGVEVEVVEYLLEGTDPLEALTALGDERVSPRASLVACTHGDVLDGLVEIVAARGVEVDASRSVRKGACLVLAFDGRAVVEARLVGPPKVAGR